MGGRDCRSSSSSSVGETGASCVDCGWRRSSRSLFFFDRFDGEASIRALRFLGMRKISICYILLSVSASLRFVFWYVGRGVVR